jgi:hypothetical protein
MPTTQNGVYTVTASFNNQAGTAWFTEIAALHALGPNGETWVPTTQPVGENFNVTASTQITITNWAADDHGDTPATASLLLPDNFYLWGRMDRPGDVDVLQVTAEVTGTLVLRVNRLALGMQPHIRVLGADGVTVLRSTDYPSQGNLYFFTVFEALAGETYYIEVTHQNSSAVGGLYAVSAGDPLDNFWEQVTCKIYLPGIHKNP